MLHLAWLVLAFFSLASMLLAQAPAPKKELKVGILDLQQVFNESAQGKQKLAELEKLTEQYRSEMADRQQKMKARQDQLAQLPFSISEEKRTNLEREIEEDQISLKRRQSDAERDLTTKQNDAMMELYSKVGPLIEDIGKARGYTLIINKSQPGILLYFDETVDITSEVIKKFNEMTATKK
jgi:outer membrane protein